MFHKPLLTVQLSQARRTLQARRADRAARLYLERELAAYTTPGNRYEWDAILSRHSDDESAEIRAILNDQYAALDHRQLNSTNPHRVA